MNSEANVQAAAAVDLGMTDDCDFAPEDDECGSSASPLRTGKEKIVEY